MPSSFSQKNFGQLIGEYRTKHMPFISQTQLAEALGVSRQTIIRIENNKDKIVRSTEFVSRLANVFGIVGHEREEFFAATGLLPDTDELSAPEQQQQQGVISRFYRDFSSYPAFVFDDFYDVHSANSYAISMLVGSFDVIAHRFKQKPAGANILHMMFDPDFGMRSGAGDGWLHLMESHVHYFRVKTEKYVKTPRFLRLMDALMALPDFPNVWETTRNSHFDAPPSPFPGRIRAVIDMAHEPSFLVVRPVGDAPHLWLNDRIVTIAYTPANQWAEQVLDNLKQQVEFKVYRADSVRGLVEIDITS